MTENTSRTTILADAHNDSAEKDFELARASLVTMINTSNEAVEELAKLADQSQNHNVYMALAKLVDSSVNANKNLLDLQEKIRKIKHADAPISEKAKTIKNNLFLTTSDLQKLIEESKK